MADVYTRPLIKRDGGEVILKEKELRDFYALRFAMRNLRSGAIVNDGAFEAMMELAGLSGMAYLRTVGRWTKESYEDLMAGADWCAGKELKFDDFVEYLVGDLGYTILHEDDEPDEDDDE